ncbi:Telomerase activating protein Est1-like, N-terminal [Dillenia turbinata]|uniref:Telomerase activating protein Est1-like, N-terminal n=1 Tax=Dillenia turbinata TaxID=194707 RepID=A0AAN8YWF7_9MAGN
MDTNSLNCLKGDKEMENHVVEIVNTEKQLWASIRAKGILQGDVRDLYRKARSSYEKVILNDKDSVECNDIEYSLWKLHYKHIDEFRGMLRRGSTGSSESNKVGTSNSANLQTDSDMHLKEFRSFLSEASEFYNDLMKKLRRSFGLLEEPMLSEDGGDDRTIEPAKLHKCQFLCHRFLICLGDLARYKELYEKPEFQKRNWSIAAIYYLRATRTWPNSGNPHNQLALLATYAGDEFLALYHCVRSLAIKEPFPDAFNNLILLFEKNRSSPACRVNTKAQFDYSKPSVKHTIQRKSQSIDSVTNVSGTSDYITPMEFVLWSLIVRMTSFFFIESSLEDFHCIFASAMVELDALMAEDDTKLNATLEAYQHLESTRKGPYRGIQLVAVLIFIIHNLMRGSGEDMGNLSAVKQLELTHLALTATFFIMGRFANRCLDVKPISSSPLLPALLIFVEWLGVVLGEALIHKADSKCESAIHYFFETLADVLNQFDHDKLEFRPPKITALWEDYELQGFVAIAHDKVFSNFSMESKNAIVFENGDENRIRRIISAAMTLVNRSSNSQKWISYDKLEKKFYTIESKNAFEASETMVKHNLEKSNDGNKCGDVAESQKVSAGESVAAEEEEEILFKPLLRYNSAPLGTSGTMTNEILAKGLVNNTLSPDECLRRASSLLVAQDHSQNDPSISNSDTSFRFNMTLKQQDPSFKTSESYSLSGIPISAGPPSLNAWVLNKGNLDVEREMKKNGFAAHGLPPIEELACEGLNCLSMREPEDSISVTTSRHISSSASYPPPPYSAPVPSAPLIPDDAVWYGTDSYAYSESKSTGSSQANGYANSNTIPIQPSSGLTIPAYLPSQPPLVGLSSSEWLHQFRNNLNLSSAGLTGNHTRPLHFYPSLNTGIFHGHDQTRFDYIDHWGTPMASNTIMFVESPALLPTYPPGYGVGEQRWDMPSHAYQSPRPYGYGVGTDLRAEQLPLLQHLKEKEWRLQWEPQLKGPTYMGN